MVEAQKLYITWSDFHQHTLALCEMLKKEGSWNKLVCISRGGLAPASLISRYLDIKYVDTICLSSYDDRTHKQDSVEVIKTIKSEDKDILLIDDLVDKGKSFRVAAEFLPNAHRACIYGKPDGIPFTHTYYMDVPQSTWIVFPWEV